MEKEKQAGSSSPSFAVELFGPKGSSKSSTSSTAHFGTIFGSSPGPSMGHGKQGSGQDYGGKAKHGTSTDYKNHKKDKNSYEDENGKVGPCYFNSSIYYGGQEVYNPPSNEKNCSPNNFKKEGDDSNENNSNCASRGNWWKGSLYY